MVKKEEKKVTADVALGLISDQEEQGDISDREVSRVGSDDEGDFSESDEEEVNKGVKRSRFDAFEEQDDEESEDDDEEKQENIALVGGDAIEQDLFNDLTKESKLLNKLKLKKLSPEQLAKHEKKIGKTGVIYISRVPPYMKPQKMRQVLSRFGEIDRLFLKPEDTKTYHRRVKYGGNKKRNYIEGWAEFVNKKDAKLCAHTLNGNILGGKKGSFYYDDVMNIKYIKGFKWTDLTEQIAKENETRQAKLQAEISQANRLNKTFVANVEKSKMISNIQKKNKEKGKQSEKDLQIRRTFKQRNVSTKRADAPTHLKPTEANNDKLNSVISSIF